MARIRTIKPEFPQSESMGRVSRDARLCFVLLWTIADDEGRLRGSSRMLASLLFPYDDDAPGLIDEWLSELEREGCIVRYLIDGATYLEVAKWASHQKIDRPSASKIPPSTEGERILANPREPSALDQGSRIKDQGEDQGPQSSRKRSATGYTPEFEQAWSEYPQRPGNSKVEAFRAWNARIKAGSTPELMLAGVKRYAAYCEAERTEPRFIKQAATFFGPDRHFDADWAVRGNQAAPRKQVESFHERDQRAKQQRWASFTGRSVDHGETIDVTPTQLEIEK